MNRNELAKRWIDTCIEKADELRIAASQLDCGTTIVDFGVKTLGGLEAGLALARVCLADLASVSIHPGDASVWPTPSIQVTTDRPLDACMGAQYAGWPVQFEKFFAMGSGPMRACRGREHVLEALHLTELEANAVGVLECDQLPNDAVCGMIANECHVAPEQLTLCVAPTRSIAGTIQVVARSVETSLHKLFELGYELNQVRSAYGSAPFPPPAPNFVEGIGRTNDAILYGGRVTLWVEGSDAFWQNQGPKVPSSSSQDWGRPFADIFRDYDCDFYKVDTGLFSPAEITVHNLSTGKAHRLGTLRPDVLAKSFGYA